MPGQPAFPTGQQLDDNLHESNGSIGAASTDAGRIGAASPDAGSSSSSPTSLMPVPSSSPTSLMPALSAQAEATNERKPLLAKQEKLTKSTAEDAARAHGSSDSAPSQRATPWDEERGRADGTLGQNNIKEKSDMKPSILLRLFVHTGYFVAALLLTGIVITGIVVVMRNRKQNLNMRSELDQRGENAIKFEELITWATANGAKGVDNLALAFFDRGGYEVTGLTRAADVKPEPLSSDYFRLKANTEQEANSNSDTIITLPSSTILSEANDQFRQSQFAVDKPEEYSIVVYLAVERRKSQVNGWHASFWSPIVRLLPSPLDYSTFHPFYARPELLVSFSVLPVTLAVRQQQLFIQTIWDKNHAEWEELARKDGVEGFSFEDYKWAFTAWKAHSNFAYDKKLKRNISAMVPFVASLTSAAAGKANAAWSFDADNPSTVTIQVRPEAKPGDELFEAKSQFGRSNDKVFELSGDLIKNNDVPVKQLGDVECDLLAIRLSSFGGSSLDKGDAEQHQLAQSFQALAKEYCQNSWAPRPSEK